MDASSNSIYHFTNFNGLKGILASGFETNYCNEYLVFKDLTIDVAFPMISFSDIPLNMAKKSILNYGDCGIGLTKEWAITNKLNPVLYVETNSIVSEILKFQNYRVKPSEQYDSSAPSLEHWNLLAFIKNYEGKLIRKGGLEQDRYRFYDEREWRFVPTRDMVSGKANNFKGKYYRDERQSLKEYDFVLNFSPSDVSQLIVDNQENRISIEKTIKQYFPKSYDDLCAKICSY